MKNTQSPIKKSESWMMFDEISPKYDLLNRLLSFGLDIHWREKIKKHLPERKKLIVLDAATGTADVLLSLIKDDRVAKGQGIDMAARMLDIGRAKIQKRGLSHKITLTHADANKIPVENNHFDVATISFGIRNMENPTAVLQELCRTLKPEGRALILEFSMPKNPILRAGHLFYLRTIVPLIGYIFSGHYRAYKYLNQTIEDFPYGDDFCRLMTTAGFHNVKANPLLWGVATIYQGDKPAP